MRKGILLKAISALLLITLAVGQFALAEGGLPGECAAYADVLREHEFLIRQYWQGGGDWQGGDYMPTVEPRAIALADIMGDETPELIFIERAGDRSCDATLCVYGIQGGEAVELLRHETWDTYATSEGVNVLYTVADSKDLCGATNGVLTGYYRWSSPDGAALAEESIQQTWMDEVIYLHNGQQIDAATYEAQAAEFPRDAATVLIYTVYHDPYGSYDLDGRDSINAAGMESVAMTYDDAMALLGGAGTAESAPAVETTDAAPAQEVGEGIPSSLPAEIIDVEIYCFDGMDSGKGLQFHADGTFEFYGAEVPGRYTGRIDTVEQLSQRVWRLHIAEADAAESFEDYGAWGFHAFQAGETIQLVLPWADESELNGQVRATATQDYEGEDAAYDGNCCYIGVEINSELWFLPYTVMVFAQ